MDKFRIEITFSTDELNQNHIKLLGNKLRDIIQGLVPITDKIDIDFLIKSEEPDDTLADETWVKQ